MMPVSDTDPNMSPESANELGHIDTALNAESSQEDSVSKGKHCSKENYSIKERIIAAINRSFRSNDKSIQHTFALNDEEKNDSKNRQSVTIIVKHIDLDKESILYTKESEITDIVDLGAFKVKEISTSDSKQYNSNHSNDKKQSEDRFKSDRHHSSSHHRSGDKNKSNRRHRISEDILKSPYLVCYSCSRKDSKKWVHADCTNKCCRSTSFFCDSCLRRKIVKNDHNNDMIREVQFSKYMYVVACPFGRGNSLHMDYDRIIHLRSPEQRHVATEFLKQAFKEDDKGFAQFTIAIVHNGAKYMPDILKLMARAHPNLKVNTTKLKSSTENELTDLMTYYKKVKETYNNGTYAFDPLNETQAACVKNADECGGYLPELLSLLEKSPFLSQVLPWGDFTTRKVRTPQESDDGPIFWCRPGEQIVSLDRNSQRSRWNSNEIENFLKERKKNMRLNDEKKLIVEELKKYRRSCSSREFLFEDRTRPHADQAWSNSFEATAAVGVIQAIHPDERPNYNRICKDIVVFQAKHLEMLEALLHIDVTAAPKQQCAEWLDDAKLNMIRQMNIQFSKLYLRDNDIYFIPRQIVHQFKTVSATLSIAWHTRLREYYETKPETELNNVEVPSEEVGSKKKSSSNSQSRSASTGSRGSRTPKKRKHSSHRSHSSCKKSKQERSTPGGEKSVESTGDASSSVPDCCSAKTPIKVELNDESNQTPEEKSACSLQLICPKVRLLDFDKDELKDDKRDETISVEIKLDDEATSTSVPSTKTENED